MSRSCVRRQKLFLVEDFQPAMERFNNFSFVVESLAQAEVFLIPIPQ